MSADLLAEFDSFYQNPAPVQNPTTNRQLELERHHFSVSQNNNGEKHNYGDFFGNYEGWPETDSINHSDIPGANQWQSGQHLVQASAGEPEDDWGDFEVGQEVEQQVQVTHGSDNRAEVKDKFDTVNSPFTSNHTKPIIQDNSMFSLYPLPAAKTLDIDWQHPQESKLKAPSKPIRVPRDENVLFDAEEDQDEDDFGDFEHVQDRATKATSYQSPHLLKTDRLSNTLMDFDSMMGEMPSTSQQVGSNVLRPSLTHGFSSFEGWTQNTGQSDSGPQGVQMREALNQNQEYEDKTWNNIHEPDITDREWHGNTQQNKNNKISGHSRPHVTPQTPNDNSWDEFGTNASPRRNRAETRDNFSDNMSRHSTNFQGLSRDHTAKPAIAEGLLTNANMNVPSNTVSSSSATTTASAPPDNIPPPAVLLPLFAAIFSLAQTQLFEYLADKKTSSETREAILTHPETQTFLASYLAIVGVLARIIAGRKLRWKRDTLLAQNMRIGPASSSGKSGGMKLAGVDKAENAKEEREVADILRLWRAQLGRLRSAVASADSGTLPELGENPVVRVAKETEGALTAPRACALCALKRNERVAKIDSKVQDSFGEWWIEHWGHRACKSFWDAQKENLSSR